MKNRGKSYAQRNKLLKKLGFQNYAQYLASPLWKEVRAKVFKAHGRYCAICGLRATEAHHLRYGTGELTGATVSRIRPLCHECHEAIEFRDGRKLTLRDSGKMFNRRLSKRADERKARRKERLFYVQEKFHKPTLSEPLWRLASKPIPAFP